MLETCSREADASLFAGSHSGGYGFVVSQSACLSVSECVHVWMACLSCGFTWNQLIRMSIFPFLSHSPFFSFLAVFSLSLSLNLLESDSSERVFIVSVAMSGIVKKRQVITGVEPCEQCYEWSDCCRSGDDEIV